jgi:lysophospholipase L1-like esterase
MPKISELDATTTAALKAKAGTTTLPADLAAKAAAAANYLVVGGAEAALPNERRLVAGANITLTDGGAGGELVIAAAGGGGGGDVTLAELASTAAGDGAALIGFKQAGTGAVNRTELDKSRDLLSFRDFGAGATQADYSAEVTSTLTQALANPSAPVVLPGAGVISPQDRLAYLCAKMAAGQTVNIACYGDSTTDGQGTTGWVANPTSGGNAVGSAAHEANALNAWPAKLETILRNMFGGTNIHVWNAGYTGQRMDNGWAYSNYAAAVLNNPAYGKPDICFIAFGLNDINTGGTQIAAHATETRKLCARMLLNGTVPVLLGCDAMYRTDTRDHKESSRQIDEVKRSVAIELGIPYIDIDMAMKQWLNCNTDEYLWAQLQSDGLHIDNTGHAFKATFIAKELFRDVVPFVSGQCRQRIETWDSRSSYVGNYSTRYTTANNAQGGNILYSSGAPTATAMMKVWVWNESPNAELIYRGMDNENYTASGTANAPFVRVTNQISGVTTSTTPAGVGYAISACRSSDVPYRICRLPYGLSLVEYVSGNSAALFYGYFELVESTTVDVRDALAPARKLIKTISAAGNTFWTPEATRDGSNEAAIVAGKTLTIYVDAEIPIGNGVVLYSNPQTVKTDRTMRSGFIIYRRTTNEIRLYAIYYDGAGTVQFAALGAVSAVLTWTGDRKAFRVTVSRSGDNQVINAYEGYTSGSAIVTATLGLASVTYAFGGRFGGVFHNATDAGGASTVTIHELLYQLD